MKSHIRSSRRSRVVAALALSAGAVVLGSVVRADPPTTQSNAAPTTQQSMMQTMTPEQKQTIQAAANQYMTVMAEWNTNARQLPDSLASPKKEQLRDTLVDVKKRLLKARKNYEAAIPNPPAGDAQTLIREGTFGMELDPTLIALGDPTATDAAKTLAASDDSKKAAVGKMRLLAADWLVAKDDKEQIKEVDQISPLLKQDDLKDPFFGSSVVALCQIDSRSTAARDALEAAAVKNYPSPNVLRLDKMLSQMRERETAMKAFEGKPMTIDGTTVEGKPFSTNELKGKVVLVDFWATWCGPCKATLPQVKETYKKYHSQGLEIVSISNDYTKDALTKFLANDPDMSWTELFDPNAASEHEWSGISKKMKITAIPQMFLIDRNGVCRSSTAREDMDEMIPKLLAEAATASAE